MLIFYAIKFSLIAFWIFSKNNILSLIHSYIGYFFIFINFSKVDKFNGDAVVQPFSLYVKIEICFLQFIVIPYGIIYIY